MLVVHFNKINALILNCIAELLFLHEEAAVERWMRKGGSEEVDERKRE